MDDCLAARMNSLTGMDDSLSEWDGKRHAGIWKIVSRRGAGDAEKEGSMFSKNVLRICEVLYEKDN